MVGEFDVGDGLVARPYCWIHNAIDVPRKGRSYGLGSSLSRVGFQGRGRPGRWSSGSPRRKPPNNSGTGPACASPPKPMLPPPAGSASGKPKTTAQARSGAACARVISPRPWWNHRSRPPDSTAAKAIPVPTVGQSVTSSRARHVEGVTAQKDAHRGQVGGAQGDVPEAGVEHCRNWAMVKMVS